MEYEYYVTEYFGEKVSSLDFPKYLKRANRYIEYITMKSELPEDEAIKDLLCVIIDLLYDYDIKVNQLNQSQSESIGIKSESIKSHSITFAEMKGNEQSELLKGTESVIYAEIRRTLLPLGFLYRGL